jgi:hypothetical protein
MEVYLEAEKIMSTAEWKQRKALAKGQRGARTDLASEKGFAPVRLNADLAGKLGISLQTASKIIVIHDRAPEDIKARCRAGELTITQAYAAVPLIAKKPNNRSLNQFFAGREKEVVSSVRTIGIKATMEAYGLKYQYNFLSWLRRYAPADGFYPSKIRNLRGGSKAMWLKNNREFVLQCVQYFGADMVMENMAMEQDTFSDFIKFEKGQFNRIEREKHQENHVNTDERDLTIEMLKADIAEVRKQLREMESLFNQFQEGVAQRIGAALIMPLVSHLTTPDRELGQLSPKNNLTLTDLPK